MRFPQAALLTATLGLGLAGCGDGTGGPLATTFTVTIRNVSTPGLLATDRAGGTVPLSPGVWAVFVVSNPLFEIGLPADEGTERIAEDGFTETKAAILDAAGNVSLHGTFDSPGGPDAGPAIFAGETATFTLDASPGDRLQFETMFVQSNDWFYAFANGGIDLFEGATPISGNVTDRLALYDAGTEEDTAPGTGPDQKPAQDPAATDVGPPDDDATVRLASTSGFTIPRTDLVIQVTITPNP